MIEVVDSTARVSTNASVAVISDNIQVDTNIVHKHNIELNTNNYVLTTEGAMGLATSGTPEWLVGALETALSGDFSDVNELIDGLKLVVNSLEDGVNQQISSLNDGLKAQNIKIDSNVSRLEDSEAAILHVENTYATEDYAIASSVDVLAAAVEDGTISSEAVIIGLSETVATDTIASSQIIQGLYSTINDASTGNSAIAGATETLYSSVGIDENGDMLADAGYLRALTTSIGDFKVDIDAEDLITLNPNGDYTATTSKMITDDSGAMTGWTTSQDSVDGQVRSEMMFLADKFQFASEPIVGATQLVPFEIDLAGASPKINMTADVSIDGNLLLTGTAWIGGDVVSNSFTWTTGNEPTGFKLSSTGF